MRLVKSLLVLASATPLVLAGPRGNHLHRRTGDDDKDSSSSSLPTKDLTSSSSAPAKDLSSLSLAGKAVLGTGISPAPETTQAVVITDVVYTILTTCPVTSLVTSGSISFEEVTTTISTVTRTSTSTLCTKCVAPPSKPAVSLTSPQEAAVSSLPSVIIFSSSQLFLTQPSASSAGSLPATVFTNTIPVIQLQTAISSKPEVPGTTASPSRGLVFPSSVSLTVLATSGASSTLEFPGFGIVPSPTSIVGSPREEFISNATSSIIPVYTAALLGNAYGGGFVSTPSVYVTKLPFPNGPSSGVPPGYGSESSITIIANNITAVVAGLEGSSTSLTGLQSPSEIGVPAFTATIASNVSILLSNLSASNIPATSPQNGGSTPTFISLSPFGGRVGEGSSSSAVPSVVSVELSSSVSSAIAGNAASIVGSATASVPTANSEFSGINVITALIAATSPAVALSAEISQVSNAVLSSVAAAGLSTSSINVQVAVVGSSTTSVIGSSGETTESSSSSSTLIGGVAIPPPMATLSPLIAATSSLQANAVAENAGSLATSANELGGTTGAAIIPTTTVAGAVLSPTFSGSGVNIEASSAGSPISGEVGATIIPSLPAEQSAGSLVTLAVGSSAEQTPPIIVASGTTAPAVVPPPAIGANGQTLSADQIAASLPTPILVANGSTAIAVVPSPVVGANGLTSLAVFSTPIAPAAGLTSPAVLLTPIVGANGLTSLAVVATPVVGVNGLTSLAIGFETETSPAAGQSNSAPTPVEGFVLVQSPALIPQVSGGFTTQANIPASGVAGVAVPSGLAESPLSGGSGGGNNSIHVLLNPTAITQFQGSATTISFGFGVGLSAFMMLLFLL